MKKILTISIAAYQVENYIGQALDSLVNGNVIDELEIFVIDDGGTDETIQIAREYAQRYPNSVFLVQKENEGYGSTVSYSIEHATGEYFKLLDGDDWYEPEGIQQFVGQLRQIKTDVVITPYFTCFADGRKEKQADVNKFIQDEDLAISDLKGNCRFGMWAITYRTGVLRESNVTFPCHCLYTDQIYSTVPFGTAKTIRFINCPVYCYRLDREGQSASRESRIKHIDDNKKVCDLLYKFYEREKAIHNVNLPYILNRVTMYAQLVIKIYLLSPVNKQVLTCIGTYDRKLKEVSPDIYRRAGKVRFYKKTALLIRTLRLFRYGKIAEVIFKVTLPKDGIKNWI